MLQERKEREGRKTGSRKKGEKGKREVETGLSDLRGMLQQFGGICE